ncbi:hypothetical protein PGIGA_G00230960 [Pangasianodon gigas]|uniref:Uncharacterized protein n=1 Tax=Pangasianodon gigas TaxID=30993 RepID=A0ACC5WLW3_PANGG|nr:hypothetical protein [Pangasianodon gigas]
MCLGSPSSGTYLIQLKREMTRGHSYNTPKPPEMFPVKSEKHRFCYEGLELLTPSRRQLANERRASSSSTSSSSSSSPRVRSVSARGGGEAGGEAGVMGSVAAPGESESARRVGVRFHVRCADAESWLCEQQQQQQQL